MSQAEAPETAPTPASPSEFRPYEGAPQRDGALLMVEAYAAIWVILMVVVLLGHLKQRTLNARITRLEAAMDRVIDEHERQP